MISFSLTDLIFCLFHPKAEEVQRVIREICKAKISLEDAHRFWDEHQDEDGNIPAIVKNKFWLWAYGDTPFEPVILEDERP